MATNPALTLQGLCAIILNCQSGLPELRLVARALWQLGATPAAALPALLAQVLHASAPAAAPSAAQSQR
eukprot:8316229-Heterocapsa_arctica.AAC.1